MKEVIAINLIVEDFHNVLVYVNSLFELNTVCNETLPLLTFVTQKGKLEDHENLTTAPIRSHFHGPTEVNGFIGVPLYLENNSFVEELKVQLEFFKVELQIIVIWLPFALPITFLITYNCKLVFF